MSADAAPHPPALGTVVADFCLPAATGETWCLRDVLKDGPVLLWVHRGHW